MTADFAIVTDQVKTIKDKLDRAGWEIANALGEQQTPDHVVWFTSTYTHGEYTVEASYRPKGAGPAEGVVRVRLTPAKVQAHPRIGVELAQDLIEVGHLAAEEGRDVRAFLESSRVWPPASWKAYQ